jgi:bifunctional enzyme CysN/CysC
MATALRAAAPDEGKRSPGADKTLLRFITCGNVDDGKSTLIGRLLYDSKLLLDDQLAALEAESRRAGRAEGALDFASLVDGLAAEREQGITIDVAYRFFDTERRKFVVADTPGHEQYTRNMATGASTAELAVILVDARKGILPQTKRHSRIVHLLGIRRIVLAVNKMDLVSYDQARFDAIVADYAAFAAEAGIEDFTAIPMSGLAGDNVTRRSQRMDWYRGPSLLEHLEDVPGEPPAADDVFRLPVQWVNRWGQDFRGYAGTIASGTLRAADPVRILPSGARTRVERIVTFDGDLAEAAAGQPVTLLLADQVDCARGDMIVADDSATPLVEQFEADLIWMAHEPLVAGRSYWLKLGTLTVAASVPSLSQ